MYELKALNGKLLSFGKAAGDNSFYVPVTFEFDNKGEVIPGSFVEVFLLSSAMENVISLPRTALAEEQGIFFIYLQLDEEGYKKGSNDRSRQRQKRSNPNWCKGWRPCSDRGCLSGSTGKRKQCNPGTQPRTLKRLGVATVFFVRRIYQVIYNSQLMKYHA